MKYQMEVCIDNIESLSNAMQGGATRIELCSSLALGGLTPSWGLMRCAGEFSVVPVFAMIRPRQGDFLYLPAEIEQMKWDIEMAAQAGLQGVVLGVLTADGDVDKEATSKLTHHAQAFNLQVTYHRAIDQCRNYQKAIDTLLDIGVNRILTSGTAPCAEQGCDVIAQMVEQVQDQMVIMAGAGINAHNVANIVARTGVKEVHLSGKTVRPSLMKLANVNARMGNADCDDFSIPITNIEALKAVAKQLTSR